jgi:hypothetical protein
VSRIRWLLPRLILFFDLGAIARSNFGSAVAVSCAVNLFFFAIYRCELPASKMIFDAAR